MMDDLRYTFEITGEEGRKRYTWAVVGPAGGIHIWAQMMDPETSFMHEKCYGGVECHSPKPMYDFAREPSHEMCWLLNAPCWHDGTSLYFSERLQPLIEMADNPASLTEYMNVELLSWYRDKLDRSHDVEPEFI